MQWLWTWGGESFGYRDGDNLWTHTGQHVGRFHGDEVFGLMAVTSVNSRAVPVTV